jgi:tRNA-Thr(GGU) m(6)t(6)A37 methyltransferase TsaA
MTEQCNNEQDSYERNDIEQISFDVIAKITTPYKEKFAIPRQPGLVSSAQGCITLLNDANNIELVRGLDQFSHIWLLFIFNATQTQGWKPLVRPPRLGGNKKLGVLATRSTFRPNPIGMSVVKLEEIRVNNKNVELIVSGIDLLDKTPIIDIKPYVPYSDSVIDAQAGFAQQQPASALAIMFTDKAITELQHYQAKRPELIKLIEEVLAQDPRPAYKKQQQDDHTYGIRLYDLNIKWRLINASQIEVFKIELEG